MKLTKFKKILVTMILPGVIQAEYLLLDQGKLTLFGPVEAVVFTDTDETWKRGLDDKFSPLSTQIQRKVIDQQIEADKIPIEPDAAKKYIDSIRKQNNFSELDMSRWFNQVGRTYQEGLDFLTTQYNNEYFLHYKFKSQLAPTEDEIFEYYDQHPEFIDEIYKIKGTKIAYSSEGKEQLKKDLEDMIKQELKDGKSEIEWSEPLYVAGDDIPDDKKFLVDMKAGEIKLIDDEKGIFEIYQLIEHQPVALVPLEERRTSIVDILNRGKLEKMLNDYNKSVKEYVGIVYLDDDYQNLENSLDHK